MKFLVCILLSCLSICTFAQTGSFPFSLANTGRVVNYAESERAKIEGLDIETAGITYPTSLPGSSTAIIPATAGGFAGTLNTPVSPGGFGPAVTKIWYVDHYAVSTTQPVLARVSLGRGNTGDKMIYQGAGVYRADARIYGGDGSALLNIYAKVGSDTTKKVIVTLSIHGYAMSADQDYDAPYYVNVYGDSNTDGSQVQNVTSRYDVWTWKLKAWYQNTKGQKIHLVDKSQSGAASGLFEKVRLGGRLEGVKTPSLGFWALGTNDTDTAAYRVNLNRFLTDWKTQYPNTPVIVCGPGPRAAGSSGETTAGFIRAIDAQVVGQQNSNGKVYYLNFGTAFTNTNDTYFTATGADGTTSATRVHWNVAGQQKIADAVTSFITTNNITLAP